MTHETTYIHAVFLSDQDRGVLYRAFDDWATACEHADKLHGIVVSLPIAYDARARTLDTTSGDGIDGLPDSQSGRANAKSHAQALGERRNAGHPDGSNLE